MKDRIWFAENQQRKEYQNFFVRLVLPTILAEFQKRLDAVSTSDIDNTVEFCWNWCKKLEVLTQDLSRELSVKLNRLRSYFDSIQEQKKKRALETQRQMHEQEQETRRLKEEEEKRKRQLQEQEEEKKRQKHLQEQEEEKKRQKIRLTGSS